MKNKGKGGNYMALFKILRGNAANLPSTKKDGYAYFCTDTHDFYIDYQKADGSLTRGQLNAYAADKLSVAKTINVSTGATGTATAFDGSQNIAIPITEIKESYLTWGGKNFSGNYGPIDAAMISTLGANRLAFLPEVGITVEYSRDSGATWTEIETENKHRLFGAFGNNYTGFTIGNNDIAGADTSTYQLRITIDSIAAKVYTSLNKFAIYVTTGGSQSCWCTIECKTVNNVISGTDTWVNFANQVPIMGWSGWNIINTKNITTHSGYEFQQESGQYQKIRFIFGNASHSGNYKGLYIGQILGFGGVGWNTPSYMAKYGSLYAYDCEQNAIFPAKITARTLASVSSTTVGETLTVTGATTLNGTTTAKAINGTTITGSSLTSTGALSVSGASVLSGALTVKGNTTLGDATSDTVTIKGPITAESTLLVKGNTTLGDATTDTVTIKGPITAESTSTFTGAATFSSTVNTGALIATSLTSNGALAITGNSTFTGTITANGNVTLGNSSTGDTTTLTSKLVANGTSNFKAAMTATSITASSTVTASGFIGNLTGNADTATEAEQAEAIEWMYFNDSGVIS